MGGRRQRVGGRRPDKTKKPTFVGFFVSILEREKRFDGEGSRNEPALPRRQELPVRRLTVAVTSGRHRVVDLQEQRLSPRVVERAR